MPNTVAEQVNFWLVLAVKLNPDPVVCAALTGTLACEHASVPGPGVWTMLAAPVAVFPVMPAVDETVQLTKVEPVVRMVPAD